MTYRYGLYLNPQPNDPIVQVQSEAEEKARELSVKNNGTPVAVWDNQDRTLKLYAGYEEFEPAR